MTSSTHPIALITGGSRGLGSAAALALARLNESRRGPLAAAHSREEAGVFS